MEYDTRNLSADFLSLLGPQVLQVQIIGSPEVLELLIVRDVCSRLLRPNFRTPWCFIPHFNLTVEPLHCVGYLVKKLKKAICALYLDAARCLSIVDVDFELANCSFDGLRRNLLANER